MNVELGCIISQLQNGFEMAELSKRARVHISSRPMKAVQKQHERMWKSWKVGSKDIASIVYIFQILRFLQWYEIYIYNLGFMK